LNQLARWFQHSKRCKASDDVAALKAESAWTDFEEFAGDRIDGECRPPIVGTAII